VPAPWSVIRWLPAGPTLSYAAAMSQHDTLIPDTPAKVLDKQGGDDQSGVHLTPVNKPTAWRWVTLPNWS
jgi:hypothetical protein